MQHGENELPESKVTLLGRRISKGRERLQQMEEKSIRDFDSNKRDLKSQIELFKWMEEQQLALTEKHECLKREVRQLRLEVQRLRMVSKSPMDRDSGWISVRRKPLTPITLETVRVNVHTNDFKLGFGKENKCSTIEVRHSFIPMFFLCN